MSTVITVENIGKKYTISHQNREECSSLREAITSSVVSLSKKLVNPFRIILPSVSNRLLPETEDFWALKDVSFEVKQGERVGIIGRNGAGKSTLLKILSRITEPTTGSIRIKGRVASLLEVGTGFHPELTGRENIFLNGAILGMHREEIRRKFDEIVDFAEIEKFLDTPVKRYSSGMYVRLAFAVAAHLEPEILIVDEVLAVGDAQFQKKCLGKMEDVSANDGRTVLFVSHSMESVFKLCNKAILLQNGTRAFYGATESAVTNYLQQDHGGLSKKKWGAEQPGNNLVRLRELYCHDSNYNIRDVFEVSESIGISMEYEVLESGHVLIPAFKIIDGFDTNIFDVHDVTPSRKRNIKEKGIYISTVWIPNNLMAEGIINISAAIVTHKPFHVHVFEKNVLSLHINESISADSARGDFSGHFPGIIRPLLSWDLKKITPESGD